MEILYIGDSRKGTTSLDRLNAMNRLGYNVSCIDLSSQLNLTNSRLSNLIHYHTGYVFLENSVVNIAQSYLNQKLSFDLIWVNSGELLGPKALRLLKSLNVPIVLYNNDDPTGHRDGRRFKSLLKAIPYYDLCVVMRELNINEYKNLGAQNVLRVTMSYDEVSHAPFRGVIEDRWKSDIAFIGACMPNENRDLFILKLIEAGLDVAIWGSRWTKSKYWNELSSHFRGETIKGEEYTKAIKGAKICIGLLSKGNRDQHTTRTFEIPYAGGLLCAERTKEHESFFQEGLEAIFWDTPEECISKCKELLIDVEKRERIRLAGMQKVKCLETGNEDLVKKVILKLKELQKL